MKFLSLASFFDFVEKLHAQPSSGIIVVRCDDSLARVFAPVLLHDPYGATLQYLERKDKSHHVIFCLSPEGLEADEEAALVHQAEALNKTLLWIVPRSHPPLVIESLRRYMSISVGEKSEPAQATKPLRTLLLPSFKNLPQRQTPDQESYLRPWIDSFMQELAQQPSTAQATQAAFESLGIVLEALRFPMQKYLLFRQMKWAFYRYLRALKSSAA